MVTYDWEDATRNVPREALSGLSRARAAFVGIREVVAVFHQQIRNDSPWPLTHTAHHPGSNPTYNIPI